MARRKNHWPPSDGPAFIRSQEFGRLLIELAHQLADRYPSMDFSDAVAHVFAWFDGKLSEDPDFIDAVKFPTRSAFRAYLRQAVWNAGRLAERKRQRHEHIVALPLSRPIITQELSPDERTALRDLVDGLEEPHRTVFAKIFFDEEDLADIAHIYGEGCTVQDVQRIYEEAIDELARRGSS